MNYVVEKVNSEKSSPASSRTFEAVKASFLPIPKIMADCMSLRYHLALEMMKGGVDSRSHLNAMLQVTFLTAYLADDGYGTIDYREISDANEAVENASRRRELTGKWMFDDPAFACFARILTLHDEQLLIAPFTAVYAAIQRLERRLERNRLMPAVIDGG